MIVRLGLRVGACALIVALVSACTPPANTKAQPAAAQTQDTPSAPPLPAPASYEPPYLFTAPIEQVHNVDALTLNGFRLGALSGTFTRTRLSDVAGQLGNHHIGHRGDAGSSEYFLCFTTPHQNRTWLIANETGGGEYITDLRIVADANAVGEENCPELTAEYRAFSLDPAFVQIGGDIAATERRLGQAPAVDGWRAYGNLVTYQQDSLSLTDTMGLNVKVENGRIVELQATKTTTN